jgi:hypothetical protein
MFPSVIIAEAPRSVVGMYQISDSGWLDILPFSLSGSGQMVNIARYLSQIFD